MGPAPAPSILQQGFDPHKGLGKSQQVIKEPNSSMSHVLLTWDWDTRRLLHVFRRGPG
jgi:hypothetical protein